MKIRNPKSKYHLNIKRNYIVLDVGGGHNPHPRANIVVDKYTDTNFHRSGNIKVLDNQKFIAADGEKLPFKDKEFDYVICCHVLEHVDNPEKFLKEIFRVGKRGYIETPSLIGENLAPRISHKWILHEENNCLYMMEKSKIDFVYAYYLGELFQEYLPKNSIGFKITERTHPNLLTIRIEWEDNFEFIVGSENEEIKNYFSGKWDNKWASKFFPKRSTFQELNETALAFIAIALSYIKSKILRRTSY